MNITTNNHWHSFLSGYELTATERAEFDYLDDIDAHDFIRYRGEVYDPNEFICIDHNVGQFGDLSEWHGYRSDSYFSGLLLRISDDGEQYQIAAYYN